MGVLSAVTIGLLVQTHNTLARFRLVGLCWFMCPSLAGAAETYEPAVPKNTHAFTMGIAICTANDNPLLVCLGAQLHAPLEGFAMSCGCQGWKHFPRWIKNHQGTNVQYCPSLPLLRLAGTRGSWQ